MAYEENNKFCPVCESDKGSMKCMEADCAWWDGLDKRCVVNAFNQLARTMCSLLREMKKHR